MSKRNEEIIDSHLGWRKCVNGKPTQYEGFDWVIVRFKEPDTDFRPLPMIAEYSKVTGKWDIENVEKNETSGYEYFESLVALEWKPIDAFEYSLPKLKRIIKSICKSLEIKDISKEFEKEVRNKF